MAASSDAEEGVATQECYSGRLQQASGRRCTCALGQTLVALQALAQLAAAADGTLPLPLLRSNGVTVALDSQSCLGTYVDACVLACSLARSHACLLACCLPV